MTQRQTADGLVPRSVSRRIFSPTLSTKVAVNPDAAGREAFWLGRPIWANPLTGDPAREWTAGWRAGLRDLCARCGDEGAGRADDAARQALLRRHRPTDVEPDGVRAVRSETKARGGS